MLSCGSAGVWHPWVEERGGSWREGGSKADADGAESAAPFESSVINFAFVRRRIKKKKREKPICGSD